MVAANPPIVLVAQSEDPYLEPDQPILLHANGDLTCGPIVLKPNRRVRDYRKQYDLTAKYLKNKGWPFDVSGIRKPDIYDVIDRMQSEGRDSITLEALLEIFSRQHRIHLMKGFMVDRLRHYGHRRWWQEYKKAQKQGDRNKVKVMNRDFEVKQQLAHRIVNRLE